MHFVGYFCVRELRVDSMRVEGSCAPELYRYHITLCVFGGVEDIVVV